MFVVKRVNGFASHRSIFSFVRRSFKLYVSAVPPDARPCGTRICKGNVRDRFSPHCRAKSKKLAFVRNEISRFLTATAAHRGNKSLEPPTSPQVRKMRKVLALRCSLNTTVYSFVRLGTKRHLVESRNSLYLH